MYIAFIDYASLYDAIEETAFNRFAFEACRHIDRLTTGIDGVKKLKIALPTEEDAVTAVKHCAAKIINLLYQIQEAERAASLGRGYTKTENGLRGNVVSSVTAGNESVSYATGSAQKTSVDMAVSDVAIKRKMISSIVQEYLSGIADANGVNLLFMGPYPYAV